MRVKPSAPRSYRPTLVAIACLFALAVAVTGLVLKNRQARPLGGIPGPVVEAVAAGDWGRVDSLLGDVTPATPSPTRRLLKAHACLAINRDNAALDLIGSVKSDEQLAQWASWTKDFKTAFPASAAARYLNGDALARVGDLNGAISEFDGAVTGARQEAMAFTARGAARAALGQDPAADFDDAMRADPKQVSAQTSNAIALLKERDGETAAGKNAETALAVAPDDAMALFVRGWLELQQRQKQQAVADLAGAARNDTVRSYLVASLRRLAGSYGGSGLSALGANGDPGTSIIAGVVAADAGAPLGDPRAMRPARDPAAPNGAGPGNDGALPDHYWIKGDRHVIIVYPTKGWVNLYVTAGKTRRQIRLSRDQQDAIAAALRANGKVTVDVRTVGGSTVVKIRVNGRTTEYVIDPNGRVHEVPPSDDDDEHGPKGPPPGGGMPIEGPPPAAAPSIPPKNSPVGGALMDLSGTKFNRGLMPITANYVLGYGDRAAK